MTLSRGLYNVRSRSKVDSPVLSGVSPEPRRVFLLLRLRPTPSSDTQELGSVY